MSQIQTTKVVQYAITGSVAASAAKVVAYMILVPGEIAPGDTTRQGHTYGQVIRRG